MTRRGRAISIAAACVVAIALTLSMPTAVSAQPKNTLRARALFDGGSKRFKAGDLPGALELYRSAYALLPRAKILLNIGLLELKLGEWVAAATSLSAYANRSDTNKKALVTVRAELVSLGKRLGKLSVQSTGTGVIFVDGNNVGRAPGTMLVWVTPGEHVVQLEGGSSRSVHVVAGQTARTTLTPPPAPSATPKLQPASNGAGAVPVSVAPTRTDLAPAATTTVHDMRRPIWRRPWLWTGVVTVGMVSAGVVFGSQSRTASDEVDRLNAMSATHNFSEATPFIDRAESRATLANIAFIAAGVTGLLTTYLLVTDKGSATRTRRPTPTATVVPQPGGAVATYLRVF